MMIAPPNAMGDGMDSVDTSAKWLSVRGIRDLGEYFPLVLPTSKTCEGETMEMVKYRDYLGDTYWVYLVVDSDGDVCIRFLEGEQEDGEMKEHASIWMHPKMAFVIGKQLTRVGVDPKNGGN